MPDGGDPLVLKSGLSAEEQSKRRIDITICRTGFGPRISVSRTSTATDVGYGALGRGESNVHKALVGLGVITTARSRTSRNGAASRRWPVDRSVACLGDAESFGGEVRVAA